MKYVLFENIKFYPLIGYENRYSVSKCGKILSHKKMQPNGGFIKEKILKTSINRYGYSVVRLSRDNKGITKTLHRVVLTNFVENKNNLDSINHKDGNKLNNNIENLEWCSHSYNIKHAWENKLLVPSEIFLNRAKKSFLRNIADKQRKLNNEIAQVIKDRYLNEKISMKKLGKDFGVSAQTICSVVNGKIYLV